jgi:uncharacterized SAM-dependent methyltransferase
MDAAPANLAIAAAESFGTSLRDDVLAGLAAPRRTLPAKWFYDEQGSELFEAICDTPEYYVTRTELAILRANLDAMAAALPGGAVLIEPGSGAGTKTRLLIDACRPSAYVAIDISRSMLEIGAAGTARLFPWLQVLASSLGRWCAPPHSQQSLRRRVVPAHRSSAGEGSAHRPTLSTPSLRAQAQ